VTTTATSAGPPDAEIVDQAILAELAKSPNRRWRAETVIDRAGVSLMTGLISLARLCGAGRIERVAPGQYRHSPGPTESVDSSQSDGVAGS